jgi:dTMP kinase
MLEGRFEAEDLAFHRKVRQGYLALAAECPRFRIIDASRPPEAVFQDIRLLLEPLLTRQPLAQLGA